MPDFVLFPFVAGFARVAVPVKRCSREADDDDVIEEGMEDLLVPSAPKHIECEEDDEFKAMFDKLLNENITTGETSQLYQFATERN